MGGNMESVSDGIESSFNVTARGEPIIGLQYMNEYNFVDPTHDEIRYVCHLCDVDSLTGTV